ARADAPGRPDRARRQYNFPERAWPVHGQRRRQYHPAMSDHQLHLTPRQALILRRVVTDYIETGHPVGSKALVESGAVDASSSTVRYELAELESLGLLGHPHTSAGRVPTD